MSNLAIEQAIAAAQAAAAQGPIVNNAVASTSGGNSVGAPVQRGTPLDVMDMIVGGTITVDGWLKVDKYGLIFGSTGKPFDSVKVKVNLNEISYCYSVRYGNPVQYDKTYDRVTSVKGGSWLDALSRAQRIDPKASEFRSADVPFILEEPLLNKDGTVALEAGKVVGHSISVTGWRSFASWLREMQSADIDVSNGSVLIDLGFEVQTNAKGTWGTLTFSNTKTA